MTTNQQTPMQKHKDEDWIKKKVASLHAKTTRTPAQQLLVDLAHETGTVPDPSSKALVISDDRKLTEAKRRLDALLRAESAREKLEAITSRVSLLVKKQKDESKKAERKERNRRLIHHGLLVELAGLHKRSDAELLGLLLAGANTEPDRWTTWARTGAQRIAARDAADAEKKAKKAKGETA